MSVTITDLGFKFMPILATNPTIPDNKYKPNKVMHEWLFAAQGVGDASGGNISLTIDFGSTFDKNHYICITAIFAYYEGINGITELITNTDCWDNLYFPGHSNENIVLWNGGAYRIYQENQLNKPLYLGRPRLKDANPGVCQFYFSTNTDSATANVLIQGYTLERPLPFTSILQP